MNEPNEIRVGMHEAKTRLSELVRMALEENADIIITQRKKPVIRLVPYNATGSNRGHGILKGKMGSYEEIANTPDSVIDSFYPDNALDNGEILKVMEEVKTTGQQAIITTQGKPSLVIKPCHEASTSSMETLQGSGIAFDHPTNPVADDDWEASSDRP